MGGRSRPDGLNAFAVEKIRVTAWGMVGLRGLTNADRKDLEQELTMDLLKRLPKYDPKKAKLRTFIARVVEHKAASILKNLMTQRLTTQRGALSLDMEHEMEDGTVFDLEEELDPRECLTGTARWSRPKAEKEALSMDMEKFIEGLPAYLRDLCVRLPVQTITEISLETKTSRSTLYSRINRIRCLLRRAGLDAYL